MSTKKELDAWSSSQLREKLEGMKPEQRLVLKESGLLPPKTIDFLNMLEEYFDPDFKNSNSLDDSIYYAWETEKYQRILKKHASQTLRKAVKDGDRSTINHFLGVVSEETDIQGIKTYERFSTWVCRTAGVTYLAGHMGSGKTDFALLMGETFKTRMEEANTPVHVGSNIRSNQETDTITTQPELQKWLEEKDGMKLFIFDEASSHASGYSKDSSKVEKQLSSMIKLIRKEDGNMIIIGHTGKDVHPDVRRLADFVEKKGKKDSVVFETVEDSSGIDKKFDITQIPATSWGYDTKEASTWSWGAGSGGKDLYDIAFEVYEASNKMTQNEVAEIFDFAQSTFSKKYRQYKAQK